MRKILLLFLINISCFAQNLTKEERQAILNQKKQEKNEEKQKITTAKLPYDDESKQVLYRRIIDVDSSLSEKQIYLSLKAWLFDNKKNFSNASKERNADGAEIFFGVPRANTIQLDQGHKGDVGETLEFPEEFKLITRGSTKFDGSSLGCLRLMYVDFEIKVVAKKGKAKIEIYALRYAHYNQVTLKLMPISAWSDKGPCSSSNEIESLLECDKCNKELTRFYHYLNTKFENIQNDFANIKFTEVSKEKW